MRGKPKFEHGIVEVLAKMPEPDIDVPPRPVTDEVVLDLPEPPSINRNSGFAKYGNRAPKVVAWRNLADAHLIYTKQNRKLGNPIQGYFEIDITWDRKLRTGRKSDIDNRIKYLMDFLQDRRVFENDGNCQDMHLRFGAAPDGCRVRIRPWDWQS
jgi:Holliday junction resolvase RusA-like endonuclease